MVSTDGEGKEAKARRRCLQSCHIARREEGREQAVRERKEREGGREIKEGGEGGEGERRETEKSEEGVGREGIRNKRSSSCYP